MTLIFSNDNRFLFSREGSDRLLELCYANRFAALSNYKKLYKQPITSLDRRFKPNKDLFCTTPLGPKKKEKEGNRSYKAELSPNSLPILGPGRKPNSFKASLFCLVESQDTASLALQSFSAAEILSLYGLLQDQPVLIQGLLKSCFACARGFTSTPAIDKPFDLSQTESKQLQARSIKPLNFLCKKSNPASKSCKALNRACTGRALASKAATKPTPCSCMRFSSLDLKNKHRLHRFLLSGNPSTKQLQNPGISEALPTGPLVATSGPVGRGLVFLKGNKEWIDRALVPDGLVLLKKKVSKIKQLFPKARVWSFAFGSSFLLVSMTSILQRHDEGRWFLTLSKNQMPGLSAISEESSWESFENITLKHLNRKNVASKKPTGKGLVKEIDCYSDVWRISFSRSWNQQLFQGYTAVFPPRAQGLATKKRSTALDENQRNAQGSLPGTQNPFFVGCPVQENRDESCHLPGALHVEQGKLGNGFSIRGNRWFAPPWYQMHARTPPKKRLSICKILPDRGELCARKGRARLAGAGQSVACKGTPWTRFVRSFRAALTKGGGYRERLNVENDSIPSKMSCSTGAPSPSFCDSRVKPKLAPDSSQHDRLKDLFYGPRNLSIDTQVFQENSQEAESLHDLSFSLKKRKSDFEELIHRNRFSFLQETSFFKADTDLSPEQEKPSFGYPLKPAKRDNSQKRAFPLKGKRGYQSSRHALRMKDDENAFRETRSFKPEMACPSLRVNSAKPDTSSCITGLAKPAERLSNYSLYKRNSVSNRLMSGYRAPETKGLHLKRMACLCRAAIKVPPALPFYESKVKEWALPLQNNAPRYFPKHPSIPASFNNLLFKKPFIKADAPLPAVRPLKRMPYRKLFLNLSKDIEPLFEQVNKAFRISPYHLTFKRSLFADYNDYLGWSKDTPAGISIAPSVEEEESIKNSWLAEQALSRGLKGLQGDPIPESLPQGGEGVEDRVLLVAEPSAPSDNEEGDNGNGGERLQSPAGTDLSGLTKKDSFLAEEEALSASLPVGEDDDKKREITRFEWLQQVREAEYMVEKRKDFQGVAYPNREALASNRLDVKPGMTRSLLVGDRKLSFFGIANLFPKRLVAQDQKQINLQILREEHDQRSRLLLEELSSEDGMLSPIALEGEEGVSIEDLLKSGALYNLSKRLERFDLLSSKRAPSTKSQHTSMLLQSEALLGAGGFATKIPSSLSAVGEKPELSQRLCSCKGKQIPSSLRTAPRNRQKSDAPAKQSSVQGTHNSYKACAKLAKPSCKAPDKPCTGQSVVSKAELCSGSCNPLSQSHLPLTNTNKRFVKSFVRGSNKASLCKALFSERQHPIYAPNRRLRLRAPQLSFSSQGSNPQSRLDDLNLSQSHRWWQKRRTTSSLLGAPSRRYLAMPEITTQDWRRIVEWQLKTYLLEEERRLEPLVLEKSEIRKTDLQGSPLQETLLLESERLGKTNHLFKIKRIAVYLPWTTVKKRLKKPFEWPLTGLSFQSLGGGAHETVEQNKNSRAFLVAHKGTSCVLSAPNKASDKPCTRLTIRSTKLLRNRRFVIARSKALLAKPCKKLCKESFTTNKKPDSCFISSISPHFKASQSNQAYQPGTPTGSSTEKRLNSLHETSVYKPFLFEARTKYSYLVVHQLLLAVATKQLFQSIYKTFERVLTHKIKNSSLALLLLPILFNATSQRDQIPEFSHLKKRLKDLAGDDDTVSSLSEIVWYLRNSCRGRMMPRGVVLVESLSSESTDYLKAIGGEAQVPVIVQSLRALPFTQNHPQRRLEKILTFAQKRAPCILFLDDLDSIGQSRTLLLKNNSTPFLRGLGTKDSPPSKTEPFSVANKTLQGEALYKLFKPFNQIAGSSSERLEKKKWKEGPNRGNSLAYKATDLQDVALYAELCSCKASSKQGLARFGSLGGKVKHRSSPVHPWSSHFRYKPSVQQEQANKRLAGQGLRPSPDGVKGENNVLQLSETEKTIEQRRVDLMLRLLTVMDGITDFNGVLIVTTSKDPSSLDPALLRPGRFEKLVNIRLPNKKKRIELLKLETARIGHTSVMPWEYLGSQTQGMTGTEISSAVNHSAFRAILQSTVHTFPTLEYGISCTNGDGSLPQNLEAQLENRFQRGVKTKEVNGHTRTTGFSACFLRESGVQNPYKALLNNSGGLSTKSCKRQACLPASRGFAQKDANKAELCKHELCKQVAFHPSLNMSQNQQRCQQGRGVTSQISFYQAGRGLVRSSIVPANKLSAQPPLTNFSRARPGDKAVQSFAHVQGSCLGDPHKALPCKNSSTRTCFAKNIVRLYAGQAAESLYLDSTAAFKNKAKADPLSQLPSTFSYKERSKASSTVAGIATNSGFYPGTSLLQSFARVCRAKTSQSSSDLTKVCKTDSFPQVRAQRLYRAYIYNDPNKACTRLVGGFTSQKLCNSCKQRAKQKALAKMFASPRRDLFCFQGIVRKLQHLGSTNFFKKGFHVGYNRHSHLRKCLRRCRDNGICNKILLKEGCNRVDKSSFWTQKISGSLKTFKRPSGNWYRLYLPKVEQNKNNREWVLPDFFSNQHISILDLKGHVLKPQASSKTVDSRLPWRKKVCPPAPVPVHRDRLFKEKEGCADSLYYNMVLSGFYVAFQSCAENRELLDLLADHLIRFKAVRLHEIARIACFYF